MLNINTKGVVQMIRCIECKQVSAIEEWNDSTKKYCGDDIVPIEDVCGKNVKVFSIVLNVI